MEGHSKHGGIGRATLIAIAGAAMVLVAPGAASAEETTETFRIPISVSGYEVKQQIVGLPNGAPRPATDGHITQMKVDLVNEDGSPVPIKRLMLHHIVFLNANLQLERPDATCDTITSFDNLGTFPGAFAERFFAAGEERAKMALPEGYGYPLGPAASNRWGVLYMVMNHQAANDNAFIEYTVTVDDDPEIQPVKPVWLDVANCSADPIYNVPGNQPPGTNHTRSRDFYVDAQKLGANGGRIVAGAGHVHGGARRLTVTQPRCDGRELARSVPTWGPEDHDFYTVRPILHEPGPINMTAFKSQAGIPVKAGEYLRLNSIYDNSRPHTRVMGIFIVYVAPDSAAAGDACEPLPEVNVVGTEEPGRHGPVPFTVPLTGFDGDGNAVKIAKPPGRTKRLGSGSTINVRDNYFPKKLLNVRVDRGAKLTWSFDSENLHNITLANGPRAIGSPNLSRDGSGYPRTHTERFRKPGTYRMFCGLHPVRMAERVVVK
jgi:plastocyanin